MKTRFYFMLVCIFAFIGSVNAQTVPVTLDVPALPSTQNCTPGPVFPMPVGYTTTPVGLQMGINNTGTDICQFQTKAFQAMVWDNVTNYVNPTNFTSQVHLSCNYNDVPVFSTIIPGGLDPDVAIYSDASGVFVQIVFENNASGRIDGYTYRWDGTTFVAYNLVPLKCTLAHDFSKKAKNPNIAATKQNGRIAVVWHEEGLVTPPQTLTITYSTTPPTTYTNTVSILESKVYIYCVDKPTNSGGALGSAGPTIVNLPGVEVIRTAPAGSNHLFDRNYNPDVSYSDEAIGTAPSPTQSVISVAFLSQWFDPSTFSIVSGNLAVVQGSNDDFRGTGTNILTTTQNFTTLYSGKPRIAARLSYPSTYTAKDFSVVMGNSTVIVPPCGGTSTISSKIHNWWFTTGGGVCPPSGVDLIQGTVYAPVTTVDPVISCVNGFGKYTVAFASINNPGKRYDIVANVYKDGAALASGFSLVNYGACSATQGGNQVLPAISSIRRTGTGTLLTDNAFSNYLFWDQTNQTVNFKKITTNIIPQGGVAIRQMQDDEQTKSKFIAYPNPTDNEILFDFKLSENEVPTEIEIFNLMGQSVDKFMIDKDSNEKKRDVSKIASGTYIAILKTDKQNHQLEFVKK